MTRIFHKEGTEFDLDVHLYEHLLKGVTVFEFEKKDGTVRRAIGTINPEFIPFDKNQVQRLVEESRDFLTGFGTDTLIQGDDEKLAKAIDPFIPKEKKERKVNPEIQSYYDFESKGWRSCNKNLIIAIYA